MITVDTQGIAHCDVCDQTFTGVLVFEGAECPNTECPSHAKGDDDGDEG